jgi:hypothetical protein
MCYDFKFLGDNYYTTEDRRVKLDAEEDYRRTYTSNVEHFCETITKLTMVKMSGFGPY